MKKPENKIKYILEELAGHLPYSIFGVIAALIMMGVLTFIIQAVGAEERMSSAAKELFHIFHPTHVLVSAIATTAMFWKHDERSIPKAVSVGFLGSVVICGLSDIVIPFFGGKFLGQSMHIHICLIEEPGLIIPFALIGVATGFMVAKTFEHSTQYSHAVHVFLSSCASLLYLMGFGLVDWMHAVAGVFFTTLLAVVLPCCLSDIVFPLVCTHQHCAHHHSS